jgi:hypothetical protein
MNNSFLVRGCQPVRDLQCVLNSAAWKERPGIELVAERFAFEQLANDEMGAVPRDAWVSRVIRKSRRELRPQFGAASRGTTAVGSAVPHPCILATDDSVRGRS